MNETRRRRRQGMPPDVERSMLAHRQLGLDFVYKYKLKHAAFDLRADGVEGGSGNDTASDAGADDSVSSGSDDDTGRQGERGVGAENERSVCLTVLLMAARGSFPKFLVICA